MQIYHSTHFDLEERDSTILRNVAVIPQDVTTQKTTSSKFIFMALSYAIVLMKYCEITQAGKCVFLG
jgi:hypothetical protein